MSLFQSFYEGFELHQISNGTVHFGKIVTAAAFNIMKVSIITDTFKDPDNKYIPPDDNNPIIYPPPLPPPANNSVNRPFLPHMPNFMNKTKILPSAPLINLQTIDVQQPPIDYSTHPARLVGYSTTQTVTRDTKLYPVLDPDEYTESKYDSRGFPSYQTIPSRIPLTKLPPPPRPPMLSQIKNTDIIISLPPESMDRQ
jgi:hypothetical protein